MGFEGRDIEGGGRPSTPQLSDRLYNSAVQVAKSAASGFVLGSMLGLIFKPKLPPLEDGKIPRGI